MRFFSPRDYIVIDYATNYVSISNLAQPTQVHGRASGHKSWKSRTSEPLAQKSNHSGRCNRSFKPVVSGDMGAGLVTRLRHLAQFMSTR